MSKTNFAQIIIADKLYVIVQTSIEEMIADALTNPNPNLKHLITNYSTIEAYRLGEYNLSSCQAQEGVLSFNFLYVNIISIRYYVMDHCPIHVGFWQWLN